MIEKTIYDKICDVFEDRIKSKLPIRKSVMHRPPECKITTYHTTIYPPGIEEDRQSAYTFQCVDNDRIKMCTISGDAYILKEISDKAVEEITTSGCKVTNQREHVTANQVWFYCKSKTFKETLEIAKVLTKY